MQNIISEWADAQKTQETLDKNPDLNRFAHEFCTRFNVKVMNTDPNRWLAVVTPSGLVAGKLEVKQSYDKKSNAIPLYLYHSPCIKKSKGSANSSSNARDSIKLSSLLKTIEKNNEQPIDKTLYKEFAGGIRYAFTSIKNVSQSFSMSIDNSITLQVFSQYLNKDTTPLDNTSMEAIKDVVKRYYEWGNRLHSARTELKRFADGSKIIGYMSNDGDPYYLIGSARFDVSDHGDEAVHIDSLARHKNLDGTGLEGVAVMFKTYFKSTGYYEDKNLFGFRHHDQYHPDIDAACGYSHGAGCWMIIPNEAPTV